MFISDDFKWDKLTIICYLGGLGGDFFCNLLHMNYDPTHTFLPNKNNKFTWHVKASTKSIHRIMNSYKDEDILKYEKVDDFNYMKLFNSNINFLDDMGYHIFNQTVINSEFNLIKKIYDEDFIAYKNNYIQDARNNFMLEYLNENSIEDCFY